MVSRTMQARSRAMRCGWRRWVVAGLLAGLVAPTEVAASGPEAGGAALDEAELRAMDLEAQGDLRGAATIWEALATSASDEGARLGAAFRAQRARRALGVMTGEIAEFCAARRAIAEVLAREVLPARARADFELFAAEVEAELAARGASGRCEAANDGASAGTPTGMPTGTPTGASAGAPAETTRTEAAATARSPRPTSPRPFVAAGAGIAAVGLGCVGAMSYGLAVDHTAAEVVLDLAAKNHERGLTTAEIEALDQAITRGRAGARLALVSGLSGGALLAVGVGLLAHGGRLARAQRLAVSPRVGPGGLVGVSLGGRF